MTVSPRRTSNHHVELLWITLVLIALVTILVDAAGWFPRAGVAP